MYCMLVIPSFCKNLIFLLYSENYYFSSINSCNGPSSATRWGCITEFILSVTLSHSGLECEAARWGAWAEPQSGMGVSGSLYLRMLWKCWSCPFPVYSLSLHWLVHSESLVITALTCTTVFASLERNASCHFIACPSVLRPNMCLSYKYI